MDKNSLEELYKRLQINSAGGSTAKADEDLTNPQMEDIYASPKQPPVQPISNLPEPQAPASSGPGVAEAAMPSGTLPRLGPTPEELKMRKQIEEQMASEIAQRGQDVALNKQALQQEAGKSAFQKMDLSPLMQMAAIAGANPKEVSMYTAPVSKEKELRDALEKSREGLSTSQSSFLKNQLERQNAQQNRNDLMNQRMIMTYSEKMGKDLDPFSAPTGTSFGRAAKSMQAADRLNVLAEQVPDLNFSRNQMVELATSTANLLSSGSTTAQSQIEHLLPRTIDRSAAGIMDWLESEPHGAGQMQFAKQMLETAARERDLAAQQIYDTQQKRLSKYQNLKKISPLDYHGIKEQFVREPEKNVHETTASIRKGTFQTPGSGTSVATPKGAMSEQEFIQQYLRAKNAKQ